MQGLTSIHSYPLVVVVGFEMGGYFWFICGALIRQKQRRASSSLGFHRFAKEYLYMIVYRRPYR